MTMTLSGTSGITFPDSTTQNGFFPSGTLMLFQQTAAPTGWTKQTTHDNKALRIVSGTASSGGSVAFTTAFASGLSADATTLSTSQMPAHNHTVNIDYLDPVTAHNHGSRQNYLMQGSLNRSGSSTDSGAVYNAGGGGSHAHTLPSFAVSYVDIIIASKS